MLILDNYNGTTIAQLGDRLWAIPLGALLS